MGVMRELLKVAPGKMTFSGLPEIKRWWKRESERVQDRGIKGGYRKPRPTEPSHLANWVTLWLSSRPEAERDAIYEEGRRLMDIVAASETPLKDLPPPGASVGGVDRGGGGSEGDGTIIGEPGVPRSGRGKGPAGRKHKSAEADHAPVCGP